jgi:hypothetical protein
LRFKVFSFQGNGFNAVEWLVEQEHRRVAEQRRCAAEPLPHAQGITARPAPGRGL